MVGGPSFEKTKALGPVKDNSLPVYETGDTEVLRSPIKSSVKHAQRRENSLLTDSDLHYYLQLEFAFIPRTQGIFREMVVKAKSYLRTYDLTGYTHQEIHKFIMRGVRSAIHILMRRRQFGKR